MGSVVRKVAKLVVIGAATAIGTLVGGPLGGRIGLLAGSMLSGSVLNDKKKALAPTPTQLSRLQARLDTQAPRKMVLGPTAFPVDIRYYEGSGANEEFVDYILVLAAHKMGALNEVWFDDQLAWTVSGGMQAPYTAYTAAFAVVYEGNAGNTQAINGGARWGSDDRLTGCAYVHIRVKRTGNSDSDQSPYANGLPTRITAIGVGMPMYDPRFDSTRGGSGAMRVDDQNTWGPSSGNPIIQSLNALLGWRINGKLSVGAGLPAKYINFDSVITAANACDEDIVLAGGGTQPRYRTAGAFSTDDAPMNIVGALLAGCAGDLLDSDGQLSFLIKTNTLAVPAVIFDDHDRLSSARWDPMGGQTNLPNIISGNFTDPSNRSLYQPVPYPSVRIDSEDGIERTASIDFATVENAAQAERLGKQTLQRMQYPGLFSAEYNMKGMAAKVGKIVWENCAPRGWLNKPFRVVSQKPSRSGRIALVLREEHEDIYAWEAEDSAAVEPAEPVQFNPRNTGPILLAREASKVAEWPRVIDSQGTKPEDNATVGAPNGTPVGDRNAEDVTGAIDEHSANWIVQAARNIDVDGEIDAAKADITDLFATYGDTVSAAASAALAAEYRKQTQSLALSAGMVPDGRFDNGADGWSLDNFEFFASSDPAYGNNLRPIDNGSGASASAPAIPVDPTRAYEISSRFVVHKNGLSMYVGIECYDVTGGYLGVVFTPAASGQLFNIGAYDVAGRYTGELYSAESDVGTSFIVGTRLIRPLLLGNWTGVAGGAHNYLFFRMEDVTELVEAESQASISTAQAVIATAQAAAAQQSAILTASVQGGSIVLNPGFDVWADSAVLPAYWDYWNSATVAKVVDAQGFSLRTSGGAADNGVAQYKLLSAGWYVFEVEATLESGTWTGAGVTISGSTHSVSFATHPDSAGDISATKPGRRTFYVIAQWPSEAIAGLHLMHNWGGLGTAASKVITWQRAVVRAATQAEIDAKTVLPALQSSVTVNQAAIAAVENTAAFYEVLVAAGGGNPAQVRMLAGKNGSAIDLVSDVLRIRNKLNGQLVDVATFEGGIARLNAALIRALAVAPTPLSQIFHKVMLEPLRFAGQHGQTIQYQGGAAYESPPTITRDTTGEVLPALPAGEAYDIRPVNITNTSFAIRAVKLVAGGAATQTSAAGSNVGGTPQWRTNKPTSANASSGDYTFSGTVTLSKLGETQIVYTDEGNPSTWRYTSSYGGQVQLYGQVGSTWTLLATRNLSRSYTTVGSQAGHDTTRSFAFNETVNSNADFGSGANRFGVHPGVLPATTITAFAGVTYNTQTTSSEVALGGNFKFVVSPQTE